MGFRFSNPRSRNDLSSFPIFASFWSGTLCEASAPSCSGPRRVDLLEFILRTVSDDIGIQRVVPVLHSLHAQRPSALNAIFEDHRRDHSRLCPSSKAWISCSTRSSNCALVSFLPSHKTCFSALTTQRIVPAATFSNSFLRCFSIRA